MSQRRKKRVFEESFKLEMVQLYNSGAPRSELVKEYDLTPSALGKWIKQYNSNQSFKPEDNLTEDEKEIIRLKKQLREKEIEVDILKQAAVCEDYLSNYC